MNSTSPRPAPRTVEITRVPAELFKVLQLAGLADSGGTAKAVVAEGLVRVNGEVETKKRRKLVPGDRILLSRQEWLVTLRRKG